MSGLTVLALAAVALAAARADVSRQSIWQDLEQLEAQGSRRLTASGDHFWAGFTNVTKTFWIFSEDGVHMYSQDGTVLKKSLSSSDVCGGPCVWLDVKSDGYKYVLATSSNGGRSGVEVFRIAGGYHVGTIPTCQHAFELDLAPYREEAWVHCWTPSEDIGDAGHVDVFSTGALLLDHKEFNIAGSPVDGSHSHGQVHVDAAYPNYAFAARRDAPVLRKLNIQTREVTNIWTNDTAAAGACHGYEFMAFSGHNKHIFARCSVCCSCGVNADTGAACPAIDAGNVSLADGSVVWGTCSSCYGSRRDTVGVVEIDVVGERVLGAHYRGHGAAGSAIPKVSPSGDLIVLIDHSGAAAQVLMAGNNGELSSDSGAPDVILGFTPGGRYDVEFIEDATYGLAIFTSTSDEFAIVAGLHQIRTRQSVNTWKAALTGDSSNGWNVRFGGRRVAWGQGSRYAFVNSDISETIQVLDLGEGPIDQVHVVRNLRNQKSAAMVYVDDYFLDQMMVPGPAGAPGAAGADGAPGAAGPRGSDGREGIHGANGADTSGVVALVIASIACTLALVTAVFTLCRVQPGAPEAQGIKSMQDASPPVQATSVGVCTV